MAAEPKPVASAVHGTLWAYVQNWAARGITLVVFFALARLLSPAEFGTFAVAMVFLTLGEMFVEQLFAPAIVQRERLDDEHLDAAFWTTLACAAAFALATLLAAPLFVRLFDAPAVEPLIMALSPVFFFMAMSAVPAALLRRSLDYRALARRTAVSNVVSGTVAVAAALAGLGVWAFVLQQLSYQLIGTFILWRSERWRPRWSFHGQALRQLSGFSARVTFVKLLELAETRIVELVVGRQLGLAALGNYALASRAHQAATQLLAAPMWEASIGVFSRRQSDPQGLNAALQQRALLAASFLAPVFLFVAASAEVLIPAVFGAKWAGAVTAFQVLCILGAVRAVTFLYGSMLQAIGAVGTSVKVAVLRSIVTLGCLPVLLRYGPAGVAACLLAGQIVAMPFVFHVISLKLELDAVQLVRNIMKPTTSAVVAALLGWATAQATAGFVPAGAAALLSLLVCSVVFLVLLALLMPRTLHQAAQGLPAAVGGRLVGWLGRLVRLQDSLRVLSCMALMKSALSIRRQSRRSGDVFVVVADTYSVVGSVGDQALFGGLVAMLREAGVKRARVLCRPGVEVPRCEGLELEALPYWGELRRARSLGRELTDARAFIVVGADVLDGFYSRFESILRLEMASFCARRGIPALLCSFSFNDRPDPATAAAFGRLPPGVTLLCRDSVSRERVARLAGERVQLTADLGFLLEPARGGSLESTVAGWLAEGHRGRGPLIGWNLSPHSLQLLSGVQRQQAIAASATAIARLVRERDATVVLVPHDFRAHASDPEMLAEVYAQLPVSVHERVLLPAGPYTAAEVKQCCVHFDLVLTGRMHLMIAALGRDVPVLAIEYQGKFAGALNHFGLGKACLLQPIDVCDVEYLYRSVTARLDTLVSTKAQITSRRGGVEAMASAAIALCLKESH